jgi:hypothetical protein
VQDGVSITCARPDPGAALWAVRFCTTRRILTPVDVESCSRELGLISGFVAGAAAGLFLVSRLSSNTHDTDLETVMTAAFVIDPLGALAGLADALMRKGQPPAGDAP